MGKILFLNGPSSCGKTTLAKALQATLDEPYLHIGIDDVIAFMPDKINNWSGGFAPLGFSWKAGRDPTGHPTQEIQKGPFAERIAETFLDIVHLLATQDYTLIVEDVAFGAPQIEEWQERLKKFDTLYVGVVIPLPILEQREKKRGDRMAGSARAQYFQVHNNVIYDLEIDTYAQTQAENIAKILSALGK